jgi:hypothetical protein
MLGAVVVLWLGSPAALAAHDADIAAWSAARRLSAAPPAAAAAEAGYDPRLAEQIEVLLEEARAAPTPASAASAFERVESLLLAHPELPQAAWLLAERHASEAHVLASRGHDAAGAGRELLERARRLEGSRAPALGSAAWAGLSALESAAPARSAVPVVGIRPLDILFVDGVRAVVRELEPGRHHVQLVRGSRRVWVGWVDTASASSELGAPGPLELRDPTLACSDLDLADVSDGPEAPRVAPGIICPRWVTARPGVEGGTDMAECAASRCAAWQRGARAIRFDAPVAAPPADAEARAWPSWATWGLLGAGTAVATSIILWQSGAFERAEPTTEFVFTGPSAAAYRF